VTISGRFCRASPRGFAYRRLLPHPPRIAFFARLLRVYQRSGLQTLARRSGVLRAMGLAEREALLPRIDDQFFFLRLGKTFHPVGERRRRVAFFGGCVAQVTFSALNEATIRVLRSNGLRGSGSGKTSLLRRAGVSRGRFETPLATSRGAI